MQNILDNEIWVDVMQTWNFFMEVNPSNLLQSAMKRGDTYGVNLILDYIYNDPITLEMISKMPVKQYTIYYIRLQILDRTMFYNGFCFKREKTL